jgi:hypothetical protein
MCIKVLIYEHFCNYFYRAWNTRMKYLWGFTTGKEKAHGRYEQFMPQQLGLQVSHSVDSEMQA